MVKKIILSLNANHLAPVGAESLCGSRRPVGLTQKRLFKMLQRTKRLLPVPMVGHWQ